MAKSKSADPPFTTAHVERWCAQLVLDSGRQMRLEPFQLEVIDDWCAGHREVWMLIPEGNAKTSLWAALGLYHLDHVLAPWVPIGAASRDQAFILYQQAAGFCRRSKLGQFRPLDGSREIRHHSNEGVGLKVYPWDPNTGDGVIPTLGLVDEGHRHPDLKLYRLWKGKLGKRKDFAVVDPDSFYEPTGETRDPQIVMMSTAGEPGSEFEMQREAIRQKASERQRTGAHLRATGGGIVYHEWMVPKVEQARDLEAVKDANPLAAISEVDLAEKLDSATLDYGEDWLRLTCNIPSRSSQAAIPEADWDACQTDEQIPDGAPILLGADHAWLLDCTALAPLWIRDEKFRLLGDPIILTPPRDGTMLDVLDVHLAYEEFIERYDVQGIVMDTSRAEDIAQWLADEKNVEVIDRGQTNALAAEDYDRWMAMMSKRYLRHTGHPGLRQHVMNAIARRLAGDKYRFDRPSTSRNTKANRQERRVIDALTAASMVHSYAVGELEEATIMVSF